jgi:hypothetical protein
MFDIVVFLTNELIIFLCVCFVAQRLCEELVDLEYINVGQICKEKSLHEGCFIVAFSSSSS